MRLGWPADNSLRQINRGLLILCVVINGYVLLAPFWPNVSYLVQTKITKPVKLNAAEDTSLSGLDRTVNRLIIPKLQIQETIHEGGDERALELGIWRRPQTSTPDQASNTVLVGHRFTYTTQPPFYHLDKLAIGDSLVVVYNKKVYAYRVQASQIVSPNAAAVEAPSAKPQLTLYTCTPLWTAKERLVYTASLEKTL